MRVGLEGRAAAVSLRRPRRRWGLEGGGRICSLSGAIAAIAESTCSTSDSPNTHPRGCLVRQSISLLPLMKSRCWAAVLPGEEITREYGYTVGGGGGCSSV